MTARVLLGLCVSAIALVSTTVASAGAPEITDIDVPLHSLGADPFVSDVCGFEVEVFNQARIRIIEFSDGTSQSHHHETYYWRANGMSLTERVNFTIALDEDETLTFRGAVFNLHVPGVGVAMVEAGTVVFGPDGGVVRLAGLHQVLDGTANVPALCDYLSGN